MFNIFKRKKKEIDSKFKKGDLVYFRYHDDLTFAYVYDIKEKDGKVFYDVQLGGQCPSFLYDMKEEDLKLKEKREN